MHHRHLLVGDAAAYSFQTAMTTMDFPQRSSVRYQLQLPVSLRLAHQELYALSENIGLAGILLSSAFLIPEGSDVELAVGIVRSRPGAFLCGRGKVVRTQRKETGDYALAIKLDGNFELRPSNTEVKGLRFPREKPRVVGSWGWNFAMAWHTET
jgi:hypothetical protein